MQFDGNRYCVPQFDAAFAARQAARHLRFGAMIRFRPAALICASASRTNDRRSSLKNGWQRSAELRKRGPDQRQSFHDCPELGGRSVESGEAQRKCRAELKKSEAPPTMSYRRKWSSPKLRATVTTDDVAAEYNAVPRRSTGRIGTHGGDFSAPLHGRESFS
jgi:hypothetical protein